MSVTRPSARRHRDSVRLDLRQTLDPSIGRTTVADDKISKESQIEAQKIARSIQRPEQTKAQTRLIAQGIEKGITEYKKQQKALARERDKARKKATKAREPEAGVPIQPAQPPATWLIWLPWVLLAASCAYILVALKFLGAA